MSHERGAYRSITRALLDGPDFQALTGVARSVFLALKIDFGPAGIEVHYPEALLWQLSHQSGWTCEQCAAALDELEAAGWIMREANVVWIVDQLTFEPSMTPGNRKHRTAIQTHVAGLPRLGIVGAFIKHYSAWFDDAERLSIPYPEFVREPGKGIDTPKTEDRDRRPKTEVPAAGATGSRPRDGVPAWPARLAAVWGAQVGHIAPGRVGKALKATVDEHGIDPVERALRGYIAVRKSDGKPCKLNWFADEARIWLERTASPLDVIDGEMSPTLELLTRPAAAKGAA